MRVEKFVRGKPMSPDAAAMSAFCDPVREAVEARRHNGMARAFHETARLFGISDRRVRAVWYREVRQVLAAELMQVQQRLLDHLEAEERRLDAQRALISARRAALMQDGPPC